MTGTLGEIRPWILEYRRGVLVLTLMPDQAFHDRVRIHGFRVCLRYVCFIFAKELLILTHTCTMFSTSGSNSDTERLSGTKEFQLRRYCGGAPFTPPTLDNRVTPQRQLRAHTCTKEIPFSHFAHPFFASKPTLLAFPNQPKLPHKYHSIFIAGDP